jgi:hypothetical protein
MEASEEEDEEDKVAMSVLSPANLETMCEANQEGVYS